MLLELFMKRKAKRKIDQLTITVPCAIFLLRKKERQFNEFIPIKKYRKATMAIFTTDKKVPIFLNSSNL